MTYVLARWIALIPFAYLALFKREAGLGYWLCAFAILASLVGDGLALLFGGTWAFVPYYRLIQYALFGLALLTPAANKLVWCVLAYAGVGTYLYFGLNAWRHEAAPYPNFMRWWYPYQATRLVGIGLFVRAAWRA